MPAPSSLARLQALYSRVEQLRTLELSQAAMDAALAAKTFAGQAALCRDMRGEERVALTRGDNLERRLVEAAYARLERSLPMLLEARGRAESRRLEAASLHRQSRLDREQMDAVVERRRTTAALLAERHAQLVMDDRFAARAAWRAAQDEAERP